MIIIFPRQEKALAEQEKANKLLEAKKLGVSAGRLQAEADAAAGGTTTAPVDEAETSEEEEEVGTSRLRGLRAVVSDPDPPTRSTAQASASAVVAKKTNKPPRGGSTGGSGGSAPGAANANTANSNKPSATVGEAPRTTSATTNTVARPVATVAAPVRGKKATDLPKFSETLLAEYKDATSDSVFFEESKSHAQLRSIVRYAGNVREKVAELQPTSAEYKSWSLVLKRFSIIETGVKIVRMKLATGKGHQKAMLQQFRWLESFRTADPVVKEYVEPKYLSDLRKECMSECEFGLDAARAMSFAQELRMGGDEAIIRFTRIGVVAVLRDEKSETIDVSNRLRLGMGAALRTVLV